MRVRVVVTVDVDPRAWAETYGTSGKSAEVRADVREYVTNLVTEQLDAMLPGENRDGQ